MHSTGLLTFPPVLSSATPVLGCLTMCLRRSPSSPFSATTHQGRFIDHHLKSSLITLLVPSIACHSVSLHVHRQRLEQPSWTVAGGADKHQRCWSNAPSRLAPGTSARPSNRIPAKHGTCIHPQTIPLIGRPQIAPPSLRNTTTHNRTFVCPSILSITLHRALEYVSCVPSNTNVTRRRHQPIEFRRSRLLVPVVPGILEQVISAAAPPTLLRILTNSPPRSNNDSQATRRICRSPVRRGRHHQNVVVNVDGSSSEALLEAMPSM